MAAALSPRFAEILAKGDSYQMVARVEVIEPSGLIILDSANSTVLNVVAGSITVDGRASFVRTVSGLTLADPTYTFVPKSKTDPFSPAANNELRLSIGALIDGVPEYIPQGIFHLDGARVEDTPEGLIISLSAYDRAAKYSRSARVISRRFMQGGQAPWTGGWPITEAILSLLKDAFPLTTMTVTGSPTHLLPEQYVMQGDDPWDAAREWADSMGYVLYFDRYGQCRLDPVPDPKTLTGVNWSYAEGEGGLVGVVRDQSNEGVINGCAVFGLNTSNTEVVRSDMIWDTDPASATYYLGPYGMVPTFIKTDKVRTYEQANEMARGHLNQHKGMVEAVDFTIVPNPAIDPLDTVKLTRVRSGFPSTGPGSEAVIVDRYTANLSATGGAMTVSCRQRRVM